jgi:hypothetical protein
MDKLHPPLSFGVFKPVGHVVVSFREAAQALSAVGQLHGEGFEDADITHYSAAQMRVQVDDDIRRSNPLASIGQDMSLVEKHGELADAGCDFLVVRARDADRAERVAVVARRLHAVTAQRYGRFIVEELIARSPGDEQSAESSETGLDVHVDPQPRA